VSTSAVEICDGIDNDGDGNVDWSPTYKPGLVKCYINADNDRCGSTTQEGYCCADENLWPKGRASTQNDCFDAYFAQYDAVQKECPCQTGGPISAQCPADASAEYIHWDKQFPRCSGQMIFTELPSMSGLPSTLQILWKQNDCAKETGEIGTVTCKWKRKKSEEECSATFHVKADKVLPLTLSVSKSEKANNCR